MAAPAVPGDDSQIRLLFQEWTAAHRAYQALFDDAASDEESAAFNQIQGLTRVITDTPAEGAAGLAIKIYVAVHMRNGLPLR